MTDVETSEKMTALVQLAGTVAHELNNIFTAVAGNLSLLGDVDETQANETIKDVVRAAQRGIDLTARLQAFAGRQPLRRQRLEANQLIVEAVRPLLRPELSDIAVQFNFMHGGCPVFVDRERFSDTIVELVRNARAAMPRGGSLKIETVAMSADGRGTRPLAAIRVIDTGIGMTDEVAARALDPMFSTRKQGVDAGWGLSRCAGFIRQCGGRLLLTSTLGEGTSVEIRLPLDR